MSDRTGKWTLGVAASVMQLFWLIGAPILGIVIYQSSATVSAASGALFDTSEWVRDPYRNVATLAALIGASVVWAIISGILVWGAVQATQLRRQRRYGIIMTAAEVRGWRRVVISASAFSLLMPLVGAMMMAAPVGAAELPPSVPAAVETWSGAATPAGTVEAAETEQAPAALRVADESVWGAYAVTEAQYDYAMAPLVASLAQDQPNPVAAPTPGDAIPEWYAVKEGSTLRGIAAEMLGSEGRWRAIRDINVGANMTDGSRFTEELRPGWTIQLPADAQPDAAEWSPLVESTHTVARGDHFWGIAADTLTEALGREATTEEIGPYWLNLIESNKDNLLSPYDPALIYPGQVLHVPAPPIMVVDGIPQVAYDTAAPPVAETVAATADGAAPESIPTTAPVPTAEVAPIAAPAAAPVAAPTVPVGMPDPVVVAAPGAAPSLWETFFADDVPENESLADAVRSVAPVRQVQPAPAADLAAPIGAPGPVEAPTPVAPAAPVPTAQATPVATPDDGGGPNWMLMGAGLSAVAAGIAVWHLRRRRTRRAARWMGEDEIGAVVELDSQTVAAVRSVEESATLSPLNGLDALGLIDAANRQWTRALSVAGRTAPIRTVRATTETIEIGVEPFVGAPDCWESHPSGLGWFLPDTVHKSDLIAYAGEQPDVAYAPTLVPVGETEEGTVLVDLERAGVVAVEGWDKGCEALLRTVGESLAAASWSDGIRIVTINVDVPCGPGWERVQPLLAGSDELEELIEASERTADGDDTRSGYEIRISGDTGPERDDLPVVVILGAGHNDLSRRLCQLAMRASSRLVVVTASHAAVVPWRLTAHPNGTVILEPMGYRMMIGAPLPEEVPAAVAAASTRQSVDALSRPADFEAFLDPGLCPEHADLDADTFVPVLAEYDTVPSAHMEAHEHGDVTAYASAGAATAVIERPVGGETPTGKAEALHEALTQNPAGTATATRPPPERTAEWHAPPGTGHDTDNHIDIDMDVDVDVDVDGGAGSDAGAADIGPPPEAPEPLSAPVDDSPERQAAIDATNERIAHLAQRGLLDVKVLEPSPIVELRLDPNTGPQECESPAITATIRDTLTYLVLCRGTSPRGDAIDTLRIAGDWRYAWSTMRRRIKSVNDLVPAGVELLTYEVSERNETHMARREPVGFTEHVTSDWKRFGDYTSAAADADDDEIRRAYLRAAMGEVGRFPLADTGAVDWWRDGVIMSNIVEGDIAAAGVELWHLETARGDHSAAAHCAERLRVANPYADVAYLCLLQSYGELNDQPRIQVVLEQYMEMVKATELPHEVDGDGPSPAILELYEALTARRRAADGAAKRHAPRRDTT